MAFGTAFSLLLAIATTTFARPTPAQPAAPDHAHSGRSLLSSYGISDWAHPADHPVNALFRRQATNLTIGSPEWIAQYPKANPDPTTMPQAWKDALAKAVAAGQIPNVTLSHAGVYPKGVDPVSPEVCNSASDCKGEGDIWEAPAGMLGIQFDDGPTPVSPRLNAFLKQNSQKATHFYIGANIRDLSQHAIEAFNQGNDMAVHTWSHRWSTSLTNEEMVAELGWTCQVIHDITGGRVPRFWRPPYGDSDNRIRAIAKLFGMVQVDWNADTDDWEIANGKTSLGAISTLFDKWLTGPKSPGLIILEHELDNSTVTAFEDAYPLMKSNGWDMRSIPDLFGIPYYLNAAGNTGPVTPMQVGSGASPAISNTPTSTTSADTNSASPSASSPAAQQGTVNKANDAPAAVSSPSKMVKFGVAALMGYVLLAL